MGKTKKRRRVPEVLWRLFRKRARSLACTIESLLPLSMSSLVRDEKDPSQYRKLLNQCFLVLSENAPPLSHFNPHSRWSQSQIVQRTIEMLISEQPMSSNVICNAYDKINHSNPIMELLCSPAWCLLLQRVGDDVMLYLLKHTSIFVPVPCKKHYQVSGPPISDLCLKFSNQTLESPDQPTSLDKCGSNKKRALVDGANSMLEIQKFSRDCVGSNVRRCSRSFSWIHGNKRSQMSLLEEVTPIIGIGTNNTEGDSNEELQKISNQIAAKSRKRSRPFSWLRHRKRKHLNFEETSIKTSSATVLTEKDNVSGRLQDDVNSCLNSCEKMPCFSVSQAPKSLVVANGAYINRKFMFYDMERSSSMFPGKHILNSLKSNIAGAKFLIGNIFGLSEINATQEMPCCQSSGFCVNKSACMYHSLVKLFKRVVRRTQCCQHLRLLDKHCAVPELNDTGKSGTSFKLSIGTILLCISCVKRLTGTHLVFVLNEKGIPVYFVMAQELFLQEWSRHVKKEELFFILKEHVKCNVLQFDKKFFVQGVGIPQGSALSPLLCSLYYGHLERNLIASFLEKTSKGASKDISRRHISMDASAEESSGDRYILLRFTDDYLFISTSKKQAASFFSRLQRGFCEYNCYMNDGKFSHNFDIGQLSGITSSRAYVGEDGISFLRWCGLLLNCCTLEVQADYTKYLNNHLSSTLTVNWQSKPGRHLRAKLCSFMRPKCHPIFFDSNINSAAVIRLNIYQAFLVCAMKFHCYVCDLSYICKLHAGFYLYIIERSLRYMYKLIKKRMRSAYHYSDVRPILQLEEEEVEWLGLYAYIQVLKRKESRHKRLISSLRCKLEHTIPTSEPLPPQLKYAVDASHSSLIWKIKY
ncbi:telomerase reverse transcriptase [Quercus suber]|uniref:telomerase reverse transcriptase n=1 Tax=Quercus suber TaxID=58331 RepID=UPI0032E0110F